MNTKKYQDHIKYGARHRRYQEYKYINRKLKTLSYLFILGLIIPYVNMALWAIVFLGCIYYLLMYIFKKQKDSQISIGFAITGIIMAPLLFKFSSFLTDIAVDHISSGPLVKNQKVINLVIIDSTSGTSNESYYLNKSPKVSSEELIKSIKPTDTVTIVNYFKTRKDTVWYMVEKIKHDNDTITGWIYNIEPEEEALPTIEKPLPTTEK